MMKKIRILAIFCLSFLLLWPGLVQPSLAQTGDSDDTPAAGVIGVASDALRCLAVGPGAPAPAAGMVNLTWQGQAKSARLVVQVAGSEASHTIKVNGQAVAQSPVQPQGQLCSTGEESPYFYLDIPLEVIVQGKNSIEITNNALPGDSWSAAYVSLEVRGEGFSGGGQFGAVSVTTLATVQTISFTNSYDSTSQEAQIQIPSSYNVAVPTPLLITVHGRSSAMQWGKDTYGSAADSKGWLLASPQLHGRWNSQIPAECYQSSPPNPPCQPEEKDLVGDGNPGYPENPGYYAYASLESQYDVIGTVQYMLAKYDNIKRDQIYLVSESMGSQISIIVAAKYPHLFAALFDNKGPADMSTWYGEQVSYYGSQNAKQVRMMRKECYVNTNTPAYPSSTWGTPTNPFCYQRRSGLNFAGNLIHTPISVTHSISDALVPITHSRNLKNTINGFNPDQPVSVFEENSHDPLIDGGPPGYHDYQPDQNAVLNFLASHTLNNTPTDINITSDESDKTFYWLKIFKSSAEQFSRVEASVTGQTVTIKISDTTTNKLSVNLGATSITDIIAQPGLGLPTGVYKVQGGGNNQDVSYSSGYLTIDVSSATTPYTVTISLIPGSSPTFYTYLPVMIRN